MAAKAMLKKRKREDIEPQAVPTKRMSNEPVVRKVCE